MSTYSLVCCSPSFLSDHLREEPPLNVFQRVLPSLLQDVDECAAPSEPCGPGHLCVNSPGSFRCECKAGYYFDGISRTCVGTWVSLKAWGGDPARWHPGVATVYASPRRALVQQSPRRDPESRDPRPVPALVLHSRVSPARRTGVLLDSRPPRVYETPAHSANAREH